MVKNKLTAYMAIVKNITMLVLFVFCGTAVAQQFTVTDNASLHDALAKARTGDRLQLQPGEYSKFIINKSVEIGCEKGSRIDAGHDGDAIRVMAENVTIRGCRIENWGDDLTKMNAGIFAEKTARAIRIVDNQLRGDAFGIWLDSTHDALIRKNKLQGNTEIRSQDRGNGIHLFNVRHARVENNIIWHTRDGIYIDTSNENELIGNEMFELRYGIHYMYSYSNRVEANYTHNTRTGYALMQSKFLTVVNNISRDDTNYGILMNYIVKSTITGNQIINVRQQQGPGGEQFVKGAEGKALFIYNAPYNDIHNNLIKQSELGIHLTAGSEGNRIHGNYFVRNKQQVKYVANREVEWSLDGRGNFWSDYQGWDRNGDRIGDEPFEPNDGIDKVLWKYPAANVLINSPSIQTLRWVQKTFPVLKSPGIKDSYPLMKNDFSASRASAKNGQY